MNKDNEKEDIFPRLIGETNFVNIKKKYFEEVVHLSFLIF